MSTLGILIWQRLRRDRVQLIIWILGIALLAVFTAASVSKSYGDTAGRSNIIQLAIANPSILMLRGTPQGGSFDAFVFFEIFTFIALLAGLMSTFMAVRHSRAEEESGRAELIASTPAARTMPTVATIVYGILVNLVLGLFVALGFMAGKMDAVGSFVAGLATAATGIAFLAVGLLVAQFVHSSRGANGLAAALVVAAYVFRGMGDALGTPSADHLYLTPAWWSWISPIGWGQATQAYTGNRLAPLLLSLALAAACVVVVFLLQARRDNGASLFVGGAARGNARSTLSGSLGLAWRLQWPTIVGWTVGGAFSGLLAGSLGGVVSKATTADPSMQKIVRGLVPGGHGTLTQIFISAIFILVGVLAAVCATQVIIRMRQEEVGGTAELLLATTVHRVRWLVDYLVIGIVAIVAVLLAAAVASGLSTLSSDSGVGGFGDSFQAAAAQLPAALVYLAVLALLFVILPNWVIGLGWAAIGIGVVCGLFGGLIGLPDWVRNISPFTHSPVPVGTSTDWSGGAWMLGIAIVAALLAAIGMRRRELSST